MNPKNLIGASFLAIATATTSFAGTLDFDFSFSDGTNIVTGTVFGLMDNGLSSASSVAATSLGFDYHYEPQFYDISEFTVMNGQITEVDFYGELPVGQPGHIELLFGAGISSGEIVNTYSQQTGPTLISSGNDLSFTLRPEMPAVPLPAGGLLLMTGLAGFAGLRQRKKPYGI